MRQDSQPLLDYLAGLKKGDTPGHPFRGNQYADGEGGEPAPNSTHNKLQLDGRTLGTLKMHYRKALSEGKEQFNFQGHQLLTSYAKYLIEYAERKLGTRDVKLRDRYGEWPAKEETQFHDRFGSWPKPKKE